MLNERVVLHERRITPRAKGTRAAGRIKSVVWHETGWMSSEETRWVSTGGVGVKREAGAGVHPEALARNKTGLGNIGTTLVCA